jgi:hypothetical protein
MYDDSKNLLKYKEGENDSFVQSKMQLDLEKHIGMYKPVAPAFGIPLMKFSEDPIE